ncbi:quinon protein alcohol dehydrogenase-like superfamily [Mycena metata]|nr:quinon protein alcohol dehydrogenase-like superfamily [Mycena metata]
MHFGERHGTRIHSVAVLLDGNLIAAGRHDGRIAMWDLKESRREIDMDLVGHGGPVFSIHANNDGDILVSGSEDATVRLWDVVKRTARVYRGHTDSVNSVALSPDMSRIASGSLDHTVRVWTTNSQVGECSVLRGHTDEVLAVAFSPDGEYIASAGKDRKISLWTTSGDKPFQQFISHAGPIYSLARTTGRFASGEYPTQPVEDEVQALHTNFVTAVAISNSGDLFASASADSTAVLWNAQTGHPAFPSLKIHSAAINCIAFSPDDNILASGSSDRTVRLLDTNTGNVVGPLLRFSCEVLFLAFFEHSTLAIGLADDTILLWDTLTHAQTLQLTCTPHGHLCALAVSRRLGRVGCMYSRPHGIVGLMLWDVATGEVLVQKDFPLRADTADPIHLEGAHIAFSDDGLYVNLRYHYSHDGRIETRSFDLATGFEVPAIAERTRALYAENAEIYQKDKMVMPLPRDFRTTDIVRCWEALGDVIMVGMSSGRVYAIDLGHAEV